MNVRCGRLVGPANQEREAQLSRRAEQYAGNAIRGGVTIGGALAGRGTYAAGTINTSAVIRCGCRSANCIDEGAPAEAPTTEWEAGKPVSGCRCSGSTMTVSNGRPILLNCRNPISLKSGRRLDKVDEPTDDPCGREVFCTQKWKEAAQTTRINHSFWPSNTERQCRFHAVFQLAFTLARETHRSLRRDTFRLVLRRHLGRRIHVRHMVVVLATGRLCPSYQR